MHNLHMEMSLICKTMNVQEKLIVCTRARFETEATAARKWLIQETIGHFRITLSLFLKASLGAHPFIYIAPRPCTGRLESFVLLSGSKGIEWAS